MEYKEVIVLGVQKLDYISRKTAKKIEGAKVFYMEIDKQESSDYFIGYKTADCFIANLESFKNFNLSEVPGKYKMSIEFRLDGGKAKANIKELEYIGNYDLVSQ